MQAVPIIAGSLFSAFLGKALADDPPSQASTPPPAAAPVTPMPTPDDKAVQAAKRRSIAAQIQRRGRQSTMLTDPVTGGSDTLGG